MTAIANGILVFTGRKDNVKLRYEFKINSVSCIPESYVGKALYVTWKRGSKRSNQGETARVILERDMREVFFGHFLTISCSTTRDQKGNFEPKNILFTLVEDNRGKAVVVEKVVVNLATFANNHQSVLRTIPIKGMMSLSLTISAVPIKVNGKLLIKSQPLLRENSKSRLALSAPCLPSPTTPNALSPTARRKVVINGEDFDLMTADSWSGSNSYESDNETSEVTDGNVSSRSSFGDEVPHSSRTSRASSLSMAQEVTSPDTGRLLTENLELRDQLTKNQQALAQSQKDVELYKNKVSELTSEAVARDLEIKRINEHARAVTDDQKEAYIKELKRDIRLANARLAESNSNYCSKVSELQRVEETLVSIRREVSEIKIIEELIYGCHIDSTLGKQLALSIWNTYVAGGKSMSYAEKIMSALSLSSKRNMSSERDLLFWLSCICELLHLTGNKKIDPGIVGIKTKLTGQNLYFEEALQLISFVNYWQITQIAMENIQPHLAAAILNENSLIVSSSSSDRSVEAPATSIILKALGHFVDALKSNQIYDTIICQFVAQMFSYVTGEWTNMLLRSEALCSAMNGFKIKMMMTELEEWTRTISKKCARDAQRQSMIIHDAANILVVAKGAFADVLMTEDFRHLNTKQIGRLIQNFTADELSPKPSTEVRDFAERNFGKEMSDSAGIFIPTSRFVEYSMDGAERYSPRKSLSKRKVL